MSATKRSRQRQPDARAASPPPPPSKRIKTTKTSHVPARQGLDFLVDEDRRIGRKLDAKLTNGVPSAKTLRVDESRAVVAQDSRDDGEVGGSQKNAIELSSTEEESSDEESDDEADHPHINGHAPLRNGDAHTNGYLDDEVELGAEDVDMADEEQDEPVGEAEEPSFGDLLQARHPDPIDVQASFTDPLAQALIPTTANHVLPNQPGTTLRTVLTQALKTNDKDLLERCFHINDINDIRLTIERLQSQHVASLLQRLAERIHRRPGRTGNLIVWIQWSLVAHGAYLASQPQVMKQLRSLSQVLRERANGLQPLLRLKGKLDMLQAQLELRQRMQAASRAANADDGMDDEGVVYVEGQDEDWTDGEDQGKAQLNVNPERPIVKTKGLTAIPGGDVADSDDDSDSDMPNGFHQEGVDGDDDEDEAEEGLFDLEAEESEDEDEEEGSDVDSQDDEDEDDEDEDEEDGEESDAGVRRISHAKLERKR